METNLRFDLADLNQDDLLAYVQECYSPDDVFKTKELEDWAEFNGYTLE